MVNFAYAPREYDLQRKVTNFTERTHTKVSSLLENRHLLLVFIEQVETKVVCDIMKCFCMIKANMRHISAVPPLLKA